MNDLFDVEADLTHQSRSGYEDGYETPEQEDYELTQKEYPLPKWISSFNEPSKCDTLFVAVGPIGHCFMEAMLSITKYEMMGSIEVNLSVQHSETDASEFYQTKWRTPVLNKSLNLPVYNKNSTALISIPNEYEFFATVQEHALVRLLLEHTNAEKVIVLSHLTDYQSPDVSVQDLEPPHLRVLMSDSCEVKLPLTLLLESGNVVTGITATLLTLCQWQKKSCYVALTLPERGQGRAVASMACLSAYQILFDVLSISMPFEELLYKSLLSTSRSLSSKQSSSVYL